MLGVLALGAVAGYGISKLTRESNPEIYITHFSRRHVTEKELVAQLAEMAFLEKRRPSHLPGPLKFFAEHQKSSSINIYEKIQKGFTSN